MDSHVSIRVPGREKPIKVEHNKTYLIPSSLFSGMESATRAPKFFTTDKERTAYYEAVVKHLGPDVKAIGRHGSKLTYHFLLLKPVLLYLDMMDSCDIFARAFGLDEIPMLKAFDVDEYRVPIKTYDIKPTDRVARIIIRRSDGWVKMSPLFSDKVYDGGKSRSYNAVITNQTMRMRRLYEREVSDIDDITAMRESFNVTGRTNKLNATRALVDNFVDVVGKTKWVHPTIFMLSLMDMSIDAGAIFTKIIIKGITNTKVEPRYVKMVEEAADEKE